jgi:tetratricopeptide (TPR) repeat protein/predicted Ser/Thr protein kinase
VADDTESYFVSLAVQRGMATREAAQECLELARAPGAGGRSVMHLLVERARIPTDQARTLHQEAVSLATQARTRGGDLQRWMSGSSTGSGAGPMPSAATGSTPTLAPGHQGGAPMAPVFGASPGPSGSTSAFGPTGTVVGRPSGLAQPQGGPPPPAWNGFTAPDGGTAGGTGPAPTPSVLGRMRSFAAGEMFGRYRLETELGRGGMGVVWRARQLDLDRPVAIKMLLTGTSADDRRRRRFIAEARAVAKLDHPNIVSIHEVGEQDGVMFFTMDLVDGPSLGEALKKQQTQQFELRRALEVARGIADGLACAHGQKLVHRDLKPANILIDKRGTPRITDFGIAKDLAAVETHTLAGEVLGTPAYMPPEQADGRTHLIDGRADVYALGAILYRMLAGRPPFEGSTPYDVISKVLTAEVVPLHKIDKTVPAEVDALVLKCLAKDRDARYPTAEALAHELGELCDQLAMSTRKALPAVRPRGGHGVAIAASVIAVLGIGVGVAGWLVARQREKELAEQREREEADKKKAREDELAREAAAKRTRALDLARQALERKGAPGEALALAREAADLAPDLVEAQVALGKLLLSVENDPKAALEALERALAVDANHLAARAARARCLLRLERPVADLEAEAALLDKLGPLGRAAAAELRADLALRKSELQVAVVHLDEAVHLDERNAALRLRLAELLLRARRFSAAEEEAAATLRLERSAAAYVVRATARKELGRVPDALSDAEEALKLESGHLEARSLAEGLRARRQPTTPPSTEHGTHDAVHVALKACRVAIARRDAPEATKQLNLAMEMQDVPCPSALTERARILLETRNYQAAMADVDRLDALQGQSPVACVLRASILARLDRREEAERAFARAMELEPQSWRLYEARANFYEDDLKDLVKAEADWGELITRAPAEERGYMIHERAHFLHRKGELARALTDMNDALALKKDNGHMWFVRAEYLFEKGDKPAALADYQEALRVGGLRPPEEQRAKQRVQELAQ